MHNNETNRNDRWTIKRIAAMAAIVILVGMYLLTLIFAIAKFPGAQELFRAYLILTVAVPILAWLLIWVIGALRGKRTFADPDILKSGSKSADDDISGQQDN